MTMAKRGYTAVSQETPANDIAGMKSHGANVVRWMLYRTWTQDNRQDWVAYKKWLNSQLVVLDSVMNECYDNGIKVIIDLHTSPGEFFEDGRQRLFYEKSHLDRYVQVWQMIAKRYKYHAALYAYELLNEPVTTYTGKKILYGHIEAQSIAAREVRKIDPFTPLVFASDMWNAPTPFFSSPVSEFENVIYSVHFYQVIEYTHQGITGFPNIPYSYPGKIGGWPVFGKEQLKQTLQKVRDFQLKYKVEIFVGEFSVVRWAAGGSQWLQDAIDIFEEYGWNWTYHAWSNYHTNPYSSTIFSLESANKSFGDETTTIAETDRKLTVLKGFKKNNTK